jgi:hypothetical protein
MATLGLLILWSGYTVGMFGFAKIKSAYGAAPTLSISDLALPSHRGTYMAAAAAWGSGTPTAASAGTTPTGSGASAPVPGTPFNPNLGGANLPTTQGPSIPSPSPTPSGPFVPAT